MLLGSLKIFRKSFKVYENNLTKIWKVFDRLSWAFAQCEENWFVFWIIFSGSSAVWVIFIILDNRWLLRYQVSVSVLVTVVIFYSFFAQPITEVEWPWLNHFRCWKNSWKSREIWWCYFNTNFNCRKNHISINRIRKLLDEFLSLG